MPKIDYVELTVKEFKELCDAMQVAYAQIELILKGERE